MATKPATSPRTWATNALYTTGPFIGQPGKADPGFGVSAEGHRPGSAFPTAAEHENFQQNRITDWITNWLRLGSSVGAADAHLIETSSAGRGTVFAFDVVNSADEIAVNVVGASPTLPAMLVRCTTGATAVQADIGSAAGKGFSTEANAGASTCFDAFLSSPTTTSSGFHAFADSSSGGVGLWVQHEGPGKSIRVDHSGTGNEAVLIACTSTTARALVVTTTNAAPAVSATSGPVTGNAIETRLGGPGGFSLYAAAGGASLSTARCIRAEGAGSSTAIEATIAGGVGANGSALRLGVSGLAGSSLSFAGRATYSTTTFAGRVDYNTTTETYYASDPSLGDQRDFMQCMGGAVIGASLNPGVITVSNVYGDVAVLALTGLDAPRREGRRFVGRFTCEVRTVAASINTLDIQILDSIDGALMVRQGTGTGATAGYSLVAVNTWQRTVTIDFETTIGAGDTGDRTFTAQCRSAIGSAIDIRDATLVPFPGLI